MSGVHRVAAGLAVAAMAAIGAGAAAVPAGAQDAGVAHSDQRNVPEAIRVPDGNTRIAVMPGRGVQTYQCVNGAFTFVQPDAILEHHGRPEVLHTRGPIWTDVKDGSSVSGAVQATSPVAGAVPQLLLTATVIRGPGFLGEVTFIQRLNTTGGVAYRGRDRLGALHGRLCVLGQAIAEK